MSYLNLAHLNPQMSPMLKAAGWDIVDVDARIKIRNMIKEAEESMQSDERKLENPKEINHFADGMYAREFPMSAGMIVTSKIHKTNHFAFIMSGKALVIDDKVGAQVVEAPCMMITRAGTKRILKVLEDSVWITVHATEKTDVSEIEKDIISEEYLETLMPKSKRVQP